MSEAEAPAVLVAEGDARVNIEAHKDSAAAVAAAPPAASHVTLNPAHNFFKNQLFLDQVMDLSDIEASQRLFIIRKYHSGFVEIADRVMGQLQMEALKGGMVRAVVSMGGTLGPHAAHTYSSGAGGNNHNSTAMLTGGSHHHHGNHHPAAAAANSLADNGSFLYANPSFALGGTSGGGSFAIGNVPTNRSEIIARAARNGSSSPPRRGGGHGGADDSEFGNFAASVNFGGGAGGDDDTQQQGHPSLLRSFDSTIGEYMRLKQLQQQHDNNGNNAADGGVNNGSFHVNNSHYAAGSGADLNNEYSPARLLASFSSPLTGPSRRRQSQSPPRMTSNSLLNTSFPVSTQPVATQHYSPTSRFADPTVIDVDISSTIHRKDVRLRGIASSYEEEQRKTEAFKMAEQRRTDAFRRKQAQMQHAQLQRAARQQLNTHNTFIQLQKTKEEVKMREIVRNREAAVEARQQTIQLQKKAQEETRRRVNIIAHDTVEATKRDYLDASARLKHNAQSRAAEEEAKRLDRRRQTRELIHRELAKEKQFEETMGAHNRREADALERRQHQSHGMRDADGVMRPYKVSTGKFGVVRDLPVESVALRPQFTPRGVRLTTETSNVRSKTPNMSNSSGVSGGGGGGGPAPINPITYHRLCGGGNPNSLRAGGGALSPAAIYEEAYGKGKRMTDLDSYYLLRGPQDVSWRR